MYFQQASYCKLFIESLAMND